MFASLFFLIIGILGITTMVIIVNKHKKSIFVNKYFIIIFSLSAIRFLLRGRSFFITEYLFEDVIVYLELLFLITIPCLYLYFKDLIIYKKWEKKDSLHFLPGLIFVVLYLINLHLTPLPNVVFKIVIGCILLSYVTYIYLAYKLLATNIWSRKSDVYIVNKQNKLIRNWSVFLYTCFVLLFVRIITLFLFHNLHYSLTSNSNYFWISAIVWLIIFVKILLTPEILYGYDLLNEKINDYKNQHIAFDNIWKLSSKTTITNIKDLKIQEKVTLNLNEYIFQIENLSFHSNVFRNPEMTLEDLAKKINMPTIHLTYIFKYHSSISFVDYKKIIRIQDAIQLLESNFLNTNTYETLAKKVGFKSYMPFYSSFKNICGLPPQEYYNKLIKNQNKA